MDAHKKLVLNYRFKVLIDNNTVSFARVSGLGMDREMEMLSEGGHSQGGYLTAGIQKNPRTLRLEGGVYSGDTSVLRKLRPGIWLRQGIVVMVLGKNGQTDVKYATGQAFVTKWEMADLDAEQGKMLVQTFEIAYTQLKLMQ